jgi:hypothetical protein
VKKKLISILVTLLVLVMPTVEWSSVDELKELAHTWLSVFREIHKNN